MIRCIQVGLGGAGRHWLKHILPQHQDAVEIVALVDAVPQALQNVQTETTLSPDALFTDLDTALKTIPCDAVLITTTLASHVPLALQALNAGKHVLLEKPFAPSLAEAQEVVATAARQERVLLVNQNYRFYPAVHAVRDFLQEERLGPVGQVEVHFRHYANSQPREGNKHYTLWQPLLVDMAIHHFDLMRCILQREPVSLFCTAWNPSWSNFTDPAAASATIRFEDEIVVNYTGSWVSTGTATAWGGDWRVECARGEIRWVTRDLAAEPGGASPLKDKAIVHPFHEEPSALPLSISPVATDFHGSLNAFVEAITNGQEPESSGRNNLPTLALSLAAVESARSGRPVELASLFTHAEKS